MAKRKSQALTEDEGAEIASIWERLEKCGGGMISFSVMRHKNLHCVTIRGNAEKIMKIFQRVKYCRDKKFVDIKFNESEPVATK